MTKELIERMQDTANICRKMSNERDADFFWWWSTWSLVIADVMDRAAEVLKEQQEASVEYNQPTPHPFNALLARVKKLEHEVDSAVDPGAVDTLKKVVNEHAQRINQTQETAKRGLNKFDALDDDISAIEERVNKYARNLFDRMLRLEDSVPAVVDTNLDELDETVAYLNRRLKQEEEAGESIAERVAGLERREGAARSRLDDAHHRIDSSFGHITQLWKAIRKMD